MSDTKTAAKMVDTVIASAPKYIKGNYTKEAFDEMKDHIGDLETIGVFPEGTAEAETFDSPLAFAKFVEQTRKYLLELALEEGKADEYWSCDFDSQLDGVCIGLCEKNGVKVIGEDHDFVVKANELELAEHTISKIDKKLEACPKRCQCRKP